MSTKALRELLEDKDIGLVWADERDSGRSWAWVADVACDVKHGLVSVPRRRRGAYHWAEVLHEVAHLELWRWKGINPAHSSDLVVCQLALDIARTYGFGKDTIDQLEHEFAREHARRMSP